MAELTDVFYGFCTFWTGDWDWLAERNGGVAQPNIIPHCPFCGSVGFETSKENWWKGIREHEANGHPGYAAMIAWAEKQCFPNYEALERAWKATDRISQEGP